jgi:hypothetical protein
MPAAFAYPHMYEQDMFRFGAIPIPTPIGPLLV